MTGDSDPGKLLDGRCGRKSLVFLSLRFETGGHLKSPGDSWKRPAPLTNNQFPRLQDRLTTENQWIESCAYPQQKLSTTLDGSLEAGGNTCGI